MIRKWIKRLVDQAIAEKLRKIADENASQPPFNINGKLEDGVVIVCAWEAGLLSDADAVKKANAWVAEYSTDGGGLPCNYPFWFPRDDSPLAQRMRRLIVEADLKVKAEALQEAKVALANAKKVTK